MSSQSVFRTTLTLLSIVEQELTSALVLEDDQDERTAVVPRNTNLKYDSTGKILLVPQPSDDPNDPLVCACTPSTNIHIVD